MLNMNKIYKINEMYYNQNCTISEISEITNHDRKTIRKYVTRDNWVNSQEMMENNRKHKLDKYKPTIEEWLQNDRNVRRKQRHTALRVFNRLKGLYSDFDCSYRTVADFVKLCKEKIYTKEQGSLPLVHIPGETQIDFGKADFYERGVLHSGSYLVVSFPYSNAGFMQLFKGENGECVEEGMKTIFQFIGGVSPRGWMDNMSAILARIQKDGTREMTDSFTRFCLHYGISIVFCNLNAGNEKGNVENKVGYLRRNLLVPIPRFDDLQEYNRKLLRECMADTERQHYKKEKNISTLFKEDRARLLKLPETEFSCCRYEKVRTDTYGKFTLDGGRHTYSVSPAHAKSYVNVKLTAYDVIIMDRSFREIVRHERLYGQDKQERMDWRPYLFQISRKPRALKYTGLYDLFPETVKTIFANKDPRSYSNVLKVLSRISNESSFETGIEVLKIAANYDQYDTESLMAIYNRISGNSIQLPEIRLAENIPRLAPYTVDMKIYDRTFLKQEADHA